MKLYEISTTLEMLWQAASDTIELDDGQLVVATNGVAITRDEALQRLEAKMTEAEGDLKTKALDIACLIKSLGAESDALKAEETRLKERRVSTEKKIAWLESYLQSHVEAGVKMEDHRSVIGWRRSVSVDVQVSADLLPERYRRSKLVVEPDKVALKEALVANSDPELAGKAQLVEKLNLSIK